MLLNQLRERTGLLHAQLEASVELMGPALTRGRYLSLLKGFYGFYGPLEQALLERAEWRGLGFATQKRWKLPRMRADFSALGLARSEIDRIPFCPAEALPSITRFEDALGCMYVLEGATLGGQLISRHLKSIFSMDASSGCAFFASYGDEVGPMWKDFAAALHRYPASADQVERLVLSACRTFQSLHDWLMLARA